MRPDVSNLLLYKDIRNQILFSSLGFLVSAAKAVSFDSNYLL